MANDQGHVEIEQKYDAPADFVLPDLQGLPDVAEVSAPRTSLLVATYFDTADFRLAAHGITLRRRRGGSDAGWHLKIPVGPDAKREVHAPLGRAQVVPARLANLVAAYTRGEPLRPIATLETSRTVVRLLDAGGEVLAEIADDAVAGQVIEPKPASPAAAPQEKPAAVPAPADEAVPAEEADAGAVDDAAEVSPSVEVAQPRDEGLDRALERATERAIERSVEQTVEHAAEIPPQDTVITAWREIEVELLAGAPALMKVIGKRLRKAGARRGASGSKLGRVLGDAVRRSRPPEPAPAAAAGNTVATVLAYLAAQRDAILTNDPKARLAEPDAVHKTRVSVRRVRSTLKSFGAVLDRKRTDPLQPELKWLADVLGEVRDLEVLRMRFTGRLERLAQATPSVASAPRGWLETLEKQEQSAYRRMNVALKDPRYFALLDALDALIADPPLTAQARQGLMPLTEGKGSAGRKGGRGGRGGKKSGKDSKPDTAGKGKGKDKRGGKDSSRSGTSDTAPRELSALMDAAWRRVERAYAAAEGAEDVEAARHETRKAAKRARYAAEAVKPVLGSRAAKRAASGEHVQEVLGGYQDGVIAMDHLKSVADRVRDPREAFTVGVLYGVEQAEAAAARAEVEATWQRASRLDDL